MKKKNTTPQCDVCQKFYDRADEDETGLCPECKPENIKPDIVISFQAELKRTRKGATINMDDWNQGLEHNESIEQETKDVKDAIEPITEEMTFETNEETKPSDTEQAEIKIEDIIQPGVFGVSNKQMIPAIRRAVDEGSVEKLRLLKKAYFYTFDKTQRYLRKRDREFIQNNDI